MSVNCGFVNAIVAELFIFMKACFCSRCTQILEQG